MAAAERTVALRALGLGDLCTAIPALRALRRASGWLTLATAAPLEPLVRLAGLADEIVVQRGLDEPLVSTTHGADLAVNLHGRGPESVELLRATRPRRLVSHTVANGRRPDSAPGEHLVAWVDGVHDSERWCRLVEVATGSPVDRRDRLVAYAGDGSPDRVIVHPGAAAPARRWPVDRFARVARHLAQVGYRVVVTGSSDERPLGVAMARICPDIDVQSGRTDLAGLVDLVAGARLAVSGDTGVAHLATALGVATVTLFGPSSPAVWGPPADGPHTVLWAGRTGDPHGSSPDPGLLAITPDDVITAAGARLRGGPARNGPVHPSKGPA